MRKFCAYMESECFLTIVLYCDKQNAGCSCTKVSAQRGRSGMSLVSKQQFHDLHVWFTYIRRCLSALTNSHEILIILSEFEIMHQQFWFYVYVLACENCQKFVCRLFMYTKLDHRDSRNVQCCHIIFYLKKQAL